MPPRKKCWNAGQKFEAWGPGAFVIVSAERGAAPRPIHSYATFLSALVAPIWVSNLSALTSSCSVSSRRAAALAILKGFAHAITARNAPSRNARRLVRRRRDRRQSQGFFARNP